MNRRSLRRLFVLGRESEAIASAVSRGAPELEVRHASFETATAAELLPADMLLAFRIPPALHHAVSGISWFQSTGAGVDGLLACPDLPTDALVTRVLDVFGPPMSDFVLMRCLEIAQDDVRQGRGQRARQWDVFYPKLLSEIVVGVLGVGEIGGTIARRLVQNGATVIGINQSGRPVEGLAEIVPVSRLDSVLPRLDVLVLVTPNTAATRALIGHAELARMKSSAWLINVSRGSCVDESALIAALSSGRIAGAALDVFEIEPLPESSPLWGMENVRISPHISGLTRPEQAADAFLQNYARLLRGEPLRGLVDRARGY